MQQAIPWKNRKVAQGAYNPNWRRGALHLATRSATYNANSVSPCIERQGENGRYMDTCPRPKTPGTW